MEQAFRIVSAEKLAMILQCPASRAQHWHAALNNAMGEFGIITRRRAAHFLAQIGHESGGLYRLEEDLSYSAPRMLEVFGRRITPVKAGQLAHNPRAFGNFIYANRNGNGDEASGDGYRYRGRSPMHITGLRNYVRIGKLIGIPLEAHPAKLVEIDIGARAAAAWWKDAGCNALADDNNTLGLSRRINLGSATRKATPAGLADRIARTERALKVLGG